jgi:hypothetical protein
VVKRAPKYSPLVWGAPTPSQKCSRVRAPCYNDGNKDERHETDCSGYLGGGEREEDEVEPAQGASQIGRKTDGGICSRDRPKSRGGENHFSGGA